MLKKGDTLAVWQRTWKKIHTVEKHLKCVNCGTNLTHFDFFHSALKVYIIITFYVDL